LCEEDGLKEPEFVQESDFRTIIWRKSSVDKHQISDRQIIKTKTTAHVGEQATEQVSEQATGQVSEQVTEVVKRIVLVLKGEMRRIEIQELLGLKHREYFRDNYIVPSLDSGYIEMTIPEIPTHREQRYRLTVKGIALKAKLQRNKKKK